MQGEPDALSDLHSVISEFLEAAVHSALASRGLYAAELFERCRIYGSLFVSRSRHPGLNSYISTVVNKLKPAIANRSLQEVAIVFLGPDKAPLERVTLNLQLAPPPPYASAAQPPFNLPALEAGLSAALLKLQYLSALGLRPLPADSSFEVVAYTAGRGAVDANFFHEDSARCMELRQPVAGRPLKSVLVDGALRLQVLLETAQ